MEVFLVSELMLVQDTDIFNLKLHSLHFGHLDSNVSNDEERKAT